MKKILVASLLSLSLSATLFADAAALYKNCAMCHGDTGEKVAQRVSKVIKDMTKGEIFEALKGYKAGTYGGKTKIMMAKKVEALSEADMKSIADLIGK